MIDLRLGNNIELIDEIDDGSIDCVFTSPPYFNAAKKYQRGKGHHYSTDFEEPLYNVVDIMEKIKPKLKEKGVVILNLGFSYGETGIMRPFDIINRIRTRLGYFIVDNVIWVKKNPIPLQKRLTNAYEYLFVISNSPFINYYNEGHKLNIINESVASYKGHNAIMPIKVAKNILETFSQEGDLILDVYSGSGTTACACKELNRNCIGFEINEDYVKLSRERLKNHNPFIKKSIDKL